VISQNDHIGKSEYVAFRFVEEKEDEKHTKWLFSLIIKAQLQQPLDCFKL